MLNDVDENSNRGSPKPEGKRLKKKKKKKKRAKQREEEAVYKVVRAGDDYVSMYALFD